MEEVLETPTGEVIHYIPHQPVIQDQAESTKMRKVYDCSAKTHCQVPSLNDCLEVGHPSSKSSEDVVYHRRYSKGLYSN